MTEKILSFLALIGAVGAWLVAISKALEATKPQIEAVKAQWSIVKPTVIDHESPGDDSSRDTIDAEAEPTRGDPDATPEA